MYDIVAVEFLLQLYFLQNYVGLHSKDLMGSSKWIIKTRLQAILNSGLISIGTKKNMSIDSGQKKTFDA